MPLSIGVQPFEIQPIDLGQPEQVEGLKSLLREYALSAEGGASALQEEALDRLPGLLVGQAHYMGWLAWRCSAEPGPDARGVSETAQVAHPPLPRRHCIGLLNAFEGVSTFRAQPLLNIHDIAVSASWRGRGVGRALMAAAEVYAKARGCCKLTLEVLEGNSRAIGLYRSAGFDPYELDPAMGRALFFEKWID